MWPLRTPLARRPVLRPRLESLEDRTVPTVVPLTAGLTFTDGPRDLTAVGATLYFEADDGIHGEQLWRTDGRPGDAALVDSGSHPVTGLWFGYISGAHAQVGNWLYFFADNMDGTFTLWRNDSSAAPVGGVSPSQAIQTVPADPDGNGPFSLTAVGNTLYYGSYSTADATWVLWKLAGADAPAGTPPTASRLSYPGSDANGVYNITSAGSTLYFGADAPGTSDVVIWASDGTPEGTAPVGDGTGGFISGLKYFFYHSYVAAGSDLYYFSGGQGGLGDTSGVLWRLHGQVADRVASVGSAVPGADYGVPGYFPTVIGDSVYFATDVGQPGGDFGIWKAQGSTASLVWQSSSTPYEPLQFTAVGPDLYFIDDAPGSGGLASPRLWKLDGSTGSVGLLRSFDYGVDRNGSDDVPYALTAVGPTLQFVGADGRLWESGGTPETTRRTDLPVTIGTQSGYNLFLFHNYAQPGAAQAYSPLAAVGSSLHYVLAGSLNRLNNPPVAAADAYTATQDTTLTVPAAAGVLANDTDPDAADAGHLTATAVTGPAHGTVTLNADGSFTYTPAAGYAGPDSFTYQATDGFDPSAAVTVSLTVNSLQQALDGVPAGGTVAVTTATPDQAHAVVAAANALDPATTPACTLVVDLGGQTIQDTTVNVPPQVTLTFVNGTFIGGSPALVVTSGTVVVRDSVFVNATDAPTILVTGGSLVLRGCVIQESTGYDQAAVQVDGGVIDLGTAADPGGNTININGPGRFTRNATATPIPAAGDTFTVDGAPLRPSTLSGVVWEDFNGDGQVDFGEGGVGGATITLTGTDDLGNPVNQTQTTDSSGAYLFLGLRPGTYRVTEAQPTGYLQGRNGVGTAGGSIAAVDQFAVPLGGQVDGLNYNFGELPAAAGPVQRGQTAGIGFWNNRNGQALIKAFNGGTGHQLADWLAATLPNTFGASAGAANLAGRSNAYVAALFQQDFVLTGVKLDAQVLATALSVYATNATLDPTRAAAQYGFTVADDGAGASAVNVGTSGDAFGVANGTTLTLMQLLLATDALSVNGALYGGNLARRRAANDVYSAVNQSGGL